MNGDETDDTSEVVSMGSTSDSSGESSCPDEEEVTILCDIVGARGITIHDEQENPGIDPRSLRPYCLVKFDGKIIHRTKCAADKGCNPIWTATTRSLFLLKTSPKALSRGILNISLYTKREKSISSRLLKTATPFLGQLNIEAHRILANCNEKRMEFNIEDAHGEESKFLGNLALRFRLATQSDRRIIELFHAHSNLSKIKSKEFINLLDAGHSNTVRSGRARPLAKLVTETNESEIAQSSFVNAISNVFTSKTVRDETTGAKKVRVKPNPDPLREAETRFMTPQEIHVETRRASQRWIEAGSGGLGKLYLEVLACHGLPNVDVGEAVGNVTDSFVSIVYEDTCAMTDVIDDELSPHWLPWTQRAFCFGMMHPASILYLGVFDYDLGIGEHEAIGRVAVNVSNLQRNTVYTLKYNLYPSSDITDRTPNGSITIRVRVECFDEKAALLAALKPRPRMHVNVQKEKTFKVVRYTCFGQFDNEEKFELTVMRSYINEILTYKSEIAYAIGDTIRSLMFWRGQVEIFSILMPLHSFVFFFMAANLVERPQLIVSFSLIGVSWILLANLTIRRQHPSPWHRCPSFGHFLYLLRTGKSRAPITSIKEFEGQEEAKAYELEWEKRLEEDLMLAEKKAALLQEIDTIGDDNISTKLATTGIPLELLSRLARYQGILGRLCTKCRWVKIIATWEESIVSFWITTVFLVTGVVSLVLPWSFILKWTGRIVVWGFFGPHMKLVDLTLRANKEKDSQFRDLVKNFDVQTKMARLRREEAMKVKDIKTLAFGKYSIEVPSFNLARHYDRPLADSSARIRRQSPKRPGLDRRVSVAKIVKETPWIPGQQLYGSMIPRPEVEAKLYNVESKQLKGNLEALRRLVDEIKKTDGASNGDKMRLRKGGNDIGTPMSFGYEVVPVEEPHPYESLRQVKESLKPPGVRASSRISVTLTADEDDFHDCAGSGRVLLENDGYRTYEVGSEPTILEEEGLEVVGLGRYSTLEKEKEDLGRDILTVESTDSLVQDPGCRLSQMFKCSEKIDVAFYRPVHNANDLDDIH